MVKSTTVLKAICLATLLPALIAISGQADVSICPRERQAWLRSLLGFRETRPPPQ